MIQRRVGLEPTSEIPAAADHQNGNGAASSYRKRRVRRTGTGTGRKRIRWMKGLARVLSDEDSVITLIRTASIVVIFGCTFTLSLYFLGTAEIVVGDDDVSLHSWKNSFLVSANIWLLGRDIIKHELHRDHENSFEDASPTVYHRRDGVDFDVLPPSKIYTIPGSMPHIGDKSDHYAQLRKEYDAMDLPFVEQRYKFKTMPMEGTSPAPYDIHNCPGKPDPNYPYAWNLLQVLDHWNPDIVEVPEDRTIFQGLCVFDYEKDYEKVLNYRKAEVPYIVSNDPSVQKTAKRWMAPGYMERLLGKENHRTEYSESNHFMYWNAGNNLRKIQHKRREDGKNPFQGDGHPDGRGVDRDLAHWQQPTKMLRMPYNDWLVRANSNTVGPHDPHYYFRLIGCGEPSPEGKCDKGASEFLFDELEFFQPKENLYMVDPKEQKGIHCRFGMAGVIAENHFDMSRNAIALMGGERRYILAHPKQCPLLSLLPKGHPSARHSAVDWCNPDLENYPEFAQAEGNEVVLQAGDVLYLPTNWFHFIVSLNVNFQCNTRSGISPDYFKPIRKCGF